MQRRIVRGSDTERIKLRWQAALRALNGNKTRGGLFGAPPSGATCMLDGQGFRSVRLHDDRVDLIAVHGAADEQFFRERAHDMLSGSQQGGGLDHAEVDERLDGFRRRADQAR